MSQVESLKHSPFSNSRGGFIIHKAVLLTLIFACYAYLTVSATELINFSIAIGLLSIASSFVMAGKHIDLGLPIICLISFIISNLIYTSFSNSVQFAYFNELVLICGIIGATITGYISGKVITKKTIPSYLASFAMPAVIFYLLYLLWGKNQGINMFLTHNTLPVISNSSIYIFAAVGIIISLLFSFSKYGRNLKATGSSLEAAIEAGIDTDSCIVTSYVLSGFLCGIAGIILNQTSVPVIITLNYPVLSWLPAVFLGTLLGNNKFSGGKLNVSGSLLGGILTVFAAQVLLIFTGSPEQVSVIILLACLISIMATSRK